MQRIEQIYNTTNYIYNKNITYDHFSKKIISAGALEFIKGFDLAISVAQQVLRNNPDWQWHIYGEGKERNKLENMIKENNMSEQIKLMGRSNNLFEKYSQYSMFVLSSRSESFGMVILEAQYNNLPVIAFNCPYGPSELIKNGVNGFLVELYSIKEMAEKIDKLINDIELRKNMSEKSTVLKDKVDKSLVVEQWKKLFDSLFNM